MSQNKPVDQLLSHDSDGIQEYDNDLPKWWLYLFWFTIVWAGVYVVYFHFTGRPMPTEELKAELAQTNAAPPSGAPDSGEKQNWAALVTSQELKDKGKAVYVSKCIACHGTEGQGLVGPNLTDKFWIHGGKPEAVFNVIANGVPEKGMLAWKNLMKKDELTQVTVFVLSLKGTNPPNPKPPQGNPEE